MKIFHFSFFQFEDKDLGDAIVCFCVIYFKNYILGFAVFFLSSFSFFFFLAGVWWWWWWWTNKWEIKENFRKSKETLQIQDNLLKKKTQKSAYFYSSTSFMQTCPSALAKVFAVLFVIKSSGAMCIFKLD